MPVILDLNLKCLFLSNKVCTYWLPYTVTSNQLWMPSSFLELSTVFSELVTV